MLTSSLSAILMFHIFQIESSVLIKMSEFKSLMNLWWSFLLSDRVEDSCWKWALKVELRSTSEWRIKIKIVEVSFWLTCCSADWVSWWDINWSTWRCFALKFNHSSCNWLIFFSSSSFLSKATFNCFAFFCDHLVQEVNVHWVVKSSLTDFKACSAYWWLCWVDYWLNETVVLRCLCFMHLQFEKWTKLLSLAKETFVA